MTSRSAFLSGAKPRRFRVLRRKALTWLPWRNSQGPRPGQFRVLASGFRVSALSKRHKSGTATPRERHPSPSSAATSPHGRWCGRLADCGVSRFQDTVGRHCRQWPRVDQIVGLRPGSLTLIKGFSGIAICRVRNYVARVIMSGQESVTISAIPAFGESAR